MITACDKPDILETIKGAGVELQQRGRYHWGLCPFHSERTPSFKVDLERQLFYCFGCQAKGDVIEFIQKLMGLSFKNTLDYLGINTSFPSAEAIKKSRHEQSKRAVISKFRQWCNDYHASICDLYRGLQIAKGMVKSIEDAEMLSWAYHLEPLWIYRLGILEGRDDQAKFGLFCEVKA